MTVGPSALLAALTTSLPEMVSEIERLVACESPSSDLEAVARSAQAVAGVGTVHLGRPPEILLVDGCTHLRWRFGAGARRLLVLGHHDTVHPLGSITQHPVTTSGDALRGPGCLDMKAGVVMAIHALAADGDLDGVTLLVTGDEELSARTSRRLIEEEAAGCDAVLVLEAATADGALKLERKGRARYEVRIAGQAAHAGLEPERGINAAVELAHQLLAAHALADPASGTTVTPTVLVGGSSANTVPDAAAFTLDVRAGSARELDRVDVAIRSLAPVLPGARLEVTGGIDAPPLERAASSGLFALAQELGAGIGLSHLKGVAVGGGSDGNLTAALGVPTLDGLGGVGDGIHTLHERVLVNQLPARTALVSLLITRVLRDGRVSPAADAATAVHP